MHIFITHCMGSFNKRQAQKKKVHILLVEFSELNPWKPGWAWILILFYRQQILASVVNYIICFVQNLAYSLHIAILKIPFIFTGTEEQKRCTNNWYTLIYIHYFMMLFIVAIMHLLCLLSKPTKVPSCLVTIIFHGFQNLKSLFSEQWRRKQNVPKQ